MTAPNIQLLLSAPQAANGYASPGSVYNSLGKWASTTQLNTAVALNNLFPDTTGPQNAQGMVDYQCLFVYNDDVVSITNVWAWLPSASNLGPLAYAVAADTTGVTSYNSVLQQAGYIAAPTLAPSTVGTWFSPSASASGGAQLPTIGPGQVAAFWIRRTATNSAAYSGDTIDIQVTFDA